MTDINPLTRLDYPDPDILRVGNTFYMVSTTMYFFPGCEILRSYDLVNWEHAAYVYDQLDSTPAQKLEDKQNIYGQGMWAASLRYHNGTFFVCFVCNDTHKTYLYTSKDINGPWQKSYIEGGFFHDNSILFDDNNRVYIVSGNREIHLTELSLNDDNTLSVKENGLNKIILKDDDEAYLGYEGCHFYKIGGKYIITAIHMPRSTGKRTESVFVASAPDGPYIGKDVCDDDKGYRNSGVAQGGIVDTPDGKYYAILFQDSGAVGRIPVLVPVTWKDIKASELKNAMHGSPLPDSIAEKEPVISFPEFGNNGVIPESFEIKNYNEGYCYESLVSSDNFMDSDKDSYGFKSCWQFNHQPDLSLVKRDSKNGIVTITTGKVCTNLVQAQNTLTMRTSFPACSASVTVDASNLNDGDYAGLSVLLSGYGLIAITKKSDGYYLVMGKRTITAGGFWGERHDDEPFEEIESIRIDSPVVTLHTAITFDVASKLKQDNSTCSLKYPEEDDTAVFFYSDEKGSPKSLGKPHKLQFKLDHFTGARFALFAYSTKQSGGSASFSDFQIH